MRRLVAILDISGPYYIVWTNKSRIQGRCIWYREKKQTRPLDLRNDDIIIWDERSINVNDVGYPKWEIISRKIERIFDRYEYSGAVWE